MKKIIYLILISFVILLTAIVIYLSTIGIKTNYFNSKIISQIKQIEPRIKLKLNDVSATLDPFNFGIKAKTIGPDLIFGDKIIKIENIKSYISLKSILNNEFALSGISISTKSLSIKDLIIFSRLFNNNPKLYIAEQLIKNGHLVADLNLEFDESGNIKNNYKLRGLVKNGQINFFKKYNFKKIDFIFEVDENIFKFNDIKLSFNKKDISIPKLIAANENEKYFISGKLITNNTVLSKKEIKDIIDPKILGLEISEVAFNSENDFKFEIIKNFKIKNFDIKSNINLNNLNLENSLKLNDFFPEIKKNILLDDHKIKLEYQKDKLSIAGTGNILFQKKTDKIDYKINKKKKKIKFNTTLFISKNSFNLGLLNYKKNENTDLELKFEGEKDFKKKLIFNEISLKEKNNLFFIKNLKLFNNKIDNVAKVDLNYIDKDGFKNDLKIKKDSKQYLISGKSFNIDKIIDELMNSESDKKSEFFNKDFKILFDIGKIYLDKNNTVNDLKGFANIDNNEIFELNLESKFSDQNNLKLTIKSNDKEKITTLYSHRAKPLISRYKFIKGFEEGDLDFYSIKKNGKSNSTLKIDNFKIQEIPVLAKLLTLASLQGIADLLTGEGIRFTDFEMKFSTNNKLMTIEEMYAIGPAISILMEGYIKENELISLKGTLVPATTVNRTISSIPLIGDILIGKKVGEGVFGVSFKIKGPPKKLETTVNPIKTLTPRFITRTLEKIKKN